MIVAEKSPRRSRQTIGPDRLRLAGGYRMYRRSDVMALLRLSKSGVAA
jgi:hypothetical protein